MLVTFFAPLSIIALYEAELEPSKNKWIKDWLSNPDEGGEDAPEFENPDVHEDDAARGLKISKVAFEDLVKAFPDTTHVSTAMVLVCSNRGRCSDDNCLSVKRSCSAAGSQTIKGTDRGAETITPQRHEYLIQGYQYKVLITDCDRVCIASGHVVLLYSRVQ